MLASCAVRSARPLALSCSAIKQLQILSGRSGDREEASGEDDIGHARATVSIMHHLFIAAAGPSSIVMCSTS
jgi:hypothetical protein